jgi:hypothetical protein
MHLEQCHRIIALEHRPAGEHLVGDQSQIILVGAAFARQTSRLFGRSMGGRAGETPIEIETKLLGQTQVQEFEIPMPVRSDVFGLQIPVDDVVGMGEVKCLSKGSNYWPDLDEWKPAPAVQQSAKGLAGNVLKYCEWLACVQTKVENSSNGRMC